jgi:ABC-2 type transport system permease protein
MAGVNGRQLNTLFKLRGKLAFRLVWREKGRIVSAIVAILFFGPMALGVAVGSAIAYRTLEDPWPMQILGIVLVAMWGIWLIAPIFLSGVNEGADISRLLIYPIPRRTLFASIILGTVFDYPTYVILPLFVAIFIGFPALWPIVLLALLIGYGQMFIIGQLSQTLLSGISQSRRFRDVAIVVGSLVGSTCYLWQVGFQRWVANAPDTVDEATILALRPLNFLQWFPTGSLARAIEQAQQGDWLNVVLWLAYSLVILAILTAVWWFLLERITTGENFLPTAAQRQQKQKPKKVRRQTSSGGLSLLPPDLAQLLQKELKSLWRLPQRRVGIIQSIFFPMLMMGAFVFQSSGEATQLPDWIGLTLPLYAFFMFWTTTQNMLAWEGDGLSSLLLTPIPRQRVFIAKGMAFFLVAGVPFVLICLILTGLTRNWQTIGGLITGLNLGLTTMGVASVASVLFPIRLNLEAKRTQTGLWSSGGGCLTGLAMVFLIPLIMWIVALPAAASLALGAWWEQPLLGIGGSLIALLYGLFIFWFSTRMAGQLLLEREAEVYTTLKQPEVAE